MIWVDKDAPVLVSCMDGCGKKALVNEVDGLAWQVLSIQGRYRCVDCWRALQEASKGGQQ